MLHLTRFLTCLILVVFGDISLNYTKELSEPTLEKESRYTLFDHIRENAETKGIYLDFINGYTDHVHTLISLNAEQSIAKVMRTDTILIAQECKRCVL